MGWYRCKGYVLGVVRVVSKVKALKEQMIDCFIGVVTVSANGGMIVGSEVSGGACVIVGEAASEKRTFSMCRYMGKKVTKK